LYGYGVLFSAELQGSRSGSEQPLLWPVSCRPTLCLFPAGPPCVCFLQAHLVSVSCRPTLCLCPAGPPCVCVLQAHLVSDRFCRGSRVAQWSKTLHLSARGVTAMPDSNPGCITSSCDWESHRAVHNWPTVVRSMKIRICS
jgi:hypothetical protein